MSDARIRAALALLCVLPVWLASPLPIQDLPSHEQVVALLANGLEWSGFAERMALDLTPRPYAITYFLWAALAKLVGVETSSRLVLSYVLAGGALSCAALVRALDPRKQIRCLLVALFAFSEIYYLGLTPNLIALPTGAWLLARRVPGLEIEPDAPFWTRALAADAFLLTLTYGLHPYTGFLTGVLLLPLALSTPDRRRRMAETLAVGAPCVVWTALVVFGAPPFEHPDMPTAFMGPASLALALFSYPVNALGSFAFLLFGPLTAALATLSLVAWGLGAIALTRGAPDPRPRSRALWPAVGVALAWYCLCPMTWRWGGMLNLRMLPFLLPLLLAAAPARARTGATTALTVAATSLVCAIASVAHVAAARELAPLERVLAAMEPRAAVAAPRAQLPANRSHVVIGLKLHLHIHAPLRYHVRQGGLSNAPLHLRTAGSPVQLLAPLPQLREGEPIDPVFRYAIGVPGATAPPGFRRVDVPDTPWSLFERSE